MNHTYKEYTQNHTCHHTHNEFQKQYARKVDVPMGIRPTSLITSATNPVSFAWCALATSSASAVLECSTVCIMPIMAVTTLIFCSYLCIK